MTTTNTCPECGRELSSSEIEGLCPACLLAQGMASMGDSTVASDAPSGELSDEDIAAIPETPGRYTILGEHAKGGMGRVLLVHDETLGRDVALKELLPEYVEDGNGTPTPVRHSKEMAARFLREARITGQLEHPSITPVHELGRRPDGTLYYTMKLVKGRTLARAIKECKTLEERLKLLPHFVDLCNAIAYAHSRGVIHRDIKPQNVMVGDYGETVILDWGLAKSAARPFTVGDSSAPTILNVRSVSRGSGVETEYGEVLGTPVYMSPEQASGKLDEMDERSDVYSLGVILYQILSGRLPFASGSIEVILDSVRYDEPPEITDSEPEAPPELIEICERAMRKRLASRYQGAAALGADVHRYQSILDADQAMRETNQQLLALNRMLEKSQARERRLREEAQANLYRANVRFAQSCIDNDQAYRAHEILARLPKQYRNWEWYYLNSQANRSDWTLDVGARTATVSVSADGKRICTGSWDACLRIFDVTERKQIAAVKAHDAKIWSVDWRSELERAVSGGEDRRLVIWDTKQMQPVHSIELEANTDFVQLSTDGARVATGMADGRAAVYDTDTGNLLFKISEDLPRELPIALSPDGTLLACAGSNGTFQLRSASNGELVRVFDTQYKAVLRLAFAPSGETIAVGFWENVAQLWDVASGELMGTLEGHRSAVLGIEFDSGGNRLLSCSRDGTARLWDVPSCTSLDVFSEHRGPVGAVRFFPDGTRAVSAGFDGTVRIWQTTRRDNHRQFKGGSCRVPSCPFSADGMRIAYPLKRSLIHVDNTSTGKLLRELGPIKARINCVSISPDGKTVAATAWDKRLRIWKIESGELMHEFVAGHDSWGWNVAFSPDGSRIAAPVDNGARVWDLATGSQVAALEPGHDREVLSLAFSPDGSQLCTASNDSTTRIWDATTGKMLQCMREPQDSLMVWSCVFSPDGKRVLSASTMPLDNLRVWDVATGRPLLVCESHGTYAFCATFNHDGTRIAAGYDDGLTKIFDAITGEELVTLPAHEMRVGNAAFSPDGVLLLTASEDDVTRIWKAERRADAETEGPDGSVAFRS